LEINSAYNDAIRNVISGTFAPDAASNTPRTEAIPSDSPDAAAAGGVAGVDATPSFRDTVKSFLDDTNDKMSTSDQLSRDLASGKTNDMNKVVTSVEEANLAMSFTLAVRNKLMDAYTEVSRMQM
jgi:flagellar hook-basal body complex protein FliE